ncbi:MAG: exosortase/archaeosortase family protein [Candidatus Hodarchaeales archaeon]
MLSTPQQSILQSVIVLLCLISGIIFCFRLFFQIPDVLAITVIIIVIYTYSRQVVPILSETMIPELIILFFSILIFRMDESIFQSNLTEFLTELTSEIVVNILLAWDLLFIIISIGLIAILFKSQGFLRKDGQKWYYFAGIPIFLLIFTIIADISQYSFTVNDSMSLIFYRLQDIIRIDIIRDCSGIYGLMIFSSSFFLFGAETKRRIQWDWKQTLLLYFGGIAGVYSLNILRILTVIYASLSTDLALKSLIHSYLGSVLILLFVIGYWVLIWRNGFIPRKNSYLDDDGSICGQLEK